MKPIPNISKLKDNKLFYLKHKTYTVKTDAEYISKYIGNAF